MGLDGGEEVGRGGGELLLEWQERERRAGRAHVAIGGGEWEEGRPPKERAAAAPVLGGGAVGGFLLDGAAVPGQAGGGGQGQVGTLVLEGGTEQLRVEELGKGSDERLGDLKTQLPASRGG